MRHLTLCAVVLVSAASCSTLHKQSEVARESPAAHVEARDDSKAAPLEKARKERGPATTPLAARVTPEAPSEGMAALGMMSPSVAMGFEGERSTAAPRPPPVSANLQAGSSDDNLQFNAYLRFLAEQGQRGLPVDLTDRIVVEVRDADGLPIADADVSIRDQGRVLLTRRTYADGRTLVFPSEFPALKGSTARIVVTALGETQELPLQDQGAHHRICQLAVRRPRPTRASLDIAFVIDTTGSMQDEIDRLKQTLDVIHFQLSHLDPAPDLRLGLVEYKDRGDDFIVRKVAFTRDLAAFRQQLASMRAYGGGDAPEDVQKGLEEALHGLEWRESGVKLAFLIGDAAPHLDYGETFTYLSAMREAARRGIKLTAIGCSGLPVEGEVVWRELAQYTMAPYVFLSRGERGDSEGSASTVSHHIGSNWVAENLETIVIRLVKSEVANLQPRLVAQQQDYFQARPGSSNEGVLQDLFRQSVKQLVDYSVERIDDRTPTVLLPLSIKTKRLEASAGRLETRLEVGLSQGTPFRLVERRGMPDLLRALELQLGDSFDSRKIVEAGRLVPARLAVLAQVAEDPSGQAEMLVKLVRLETGELLSLSLLKIDRVLLQ